MHQISIRLLRLSLFGVILTSQTLGAAVDEQAADTSTSAAASEQRTDAESSGDEQTSKSSSDSKSSSESCSPRYLLRYNLSDGDELRYLSEQTVHQKALAPAGQKTDTTRVKQKRLFRVSQSDGMTSKVSMQFEHVHMEIQSDDKEPEVFDSTMPRKEIPEKFRGIAGSLKGAAPVFVTRNDGTPVDEDGTESVPEGGQASFMMPLPAEEIAVGDSWKVFIPVKVRVAEGVMQEIRLLRTFKLKAVEDDVASISFSTSVVTPVKSPAVKAQLLQATPSGQVDFNVARGLVERREMKFDTTVLGALGPNTMLTATGKTVETLVSDEAEAAVSNR